MMKRTSVLVPLAVFLTACAASTGEGTRRSSRVITAEEIAETSATTAYDAIRLRRPHWLNTRAAPTMTNPDGDPPAVYLDGVRMEGFRELERIRASTVQRMELMSPSDATNRFGTGHTGGAILVTTR